MTEQKTLPQEAWNDVRDVWMGMKELWNHGSFEEKVLGLPILTVSFALCATGVCAVARAIESRMQERTH